MVGGSPSSEETNLPLKLPDVSVSTPNKDIKFSYNLVKITLFDYLEDSDKCENLRMIVAGTAWSGKSFLIMSCSINS